MHIDGRTQLVGLVGYPIGHSRSPAVHNAAFQSLGLNWIYLPLRVPSGSLEYALRGLRCLDFRGWNITIPHKVEAVGFLDEVREEARELNAVNTVVREDGYLVGYNTDVQGFCDFLRERDIEVSGISAMIIGAGGAARAVALSLARGGVSRVIIANRTPGKAAELRSLLKRATGLSEISVRKLDYRDLSIIRECDLVVNCTPLAVRDADELPVTYEDFAEGQWAVDLNYAVRRTAFLEKASLRGASVANGEGMLLYQAAASFRMWTGMDAPLEDMRKAFQEALVSEG